MLSPADFDMLFQSATVETRHARTARGRQRPALVPALAPALATGRRAPARKGPGTGSKK